MGLCAGLFDCSAGLCGVLRGSTGFSEGSDPMLLTLRNCWIKYLERPLKNSRNSEYLEPHHYSRAIFEGDSFFFCVVTPSRRLHKTQPLQARFPLPRRVVLRSQKEREGFGVDNRLRRGGVDGRKRKKGCSNKGGQKFSAAGRQRSPLNISRTSS